MDTAQFEAALQRDGYTETATRSQPPGHSAPEHSHPFDVRAMVLDGEITLTVDGKGTAYRAGDVFVMESGCRHSEDIGPEGVRILSGRRHKPA